MSVYANGREVSGKAQPNKIIAGFPSVCLSPPSPPAGPIPIPYPMFTDASKTSKGSRTVKVKKKEVGKKNVSLYKNSKGNEPATRSFGMDVVSHTLSGATKHLAWSFDVKIEGKNAIRFLDLTTTNHNNPATAITIDAASLNVALITDPNNPCKVLAKANETTRDSMKASEVGYVKTAGGDKATLTHAYYQPPEGSPSLMRASSRKNVSQKDSFVEGITYEDKHGTIRGSKGGDLAVDKDSSKLKSRVCDGSFEYNSGFSRPHSSHTESRILEEIFRPRDSGAPPPSADRKGTLVLAIDWPGGSDVAAPGSSEKKKEKAAANKRKGLDSRSPCPACKRLLCFATQCFDIKICDEKKEPQPLNCKPPATPPPGAR